jgi:hypothetical protein
MPRVLQRVQDAVKEWDTYRERASQNKIDGNTDNT